VQGTRRGGWVPLLCCPVNSRQHKPLQRAAAAGPHPAATRRLVWVLQMAGLVLFSVFWVAILVRQTR
jgi:hypothetical protein